MPDGQPVSSGWYSRISPGWQSSAAQILSSVSKRTPFTFQYAILAATQHLVYLMLSTDDALKPEEATDLLNKIQSIRTKLATRRAPTQPPKVLSLIGLQLTSLEAGVVCLPAGEQAEGVKAGMDIVFGFAESLASGKLVNEKLTNGVGSLLALGSKAARIGTVLRCTPAFYPAIPTKNAIHSCNCCSQGSVLD